MSYSSNKWKKLQKILRRLILSVSIISIMYLQNRFSVLPIDTTINFQDKILPASYTLVDWHYNSGRELDSQDIVVTTKNICYIIATKNNILNQENGMLSVDNMSTNFSVPTDFVIPKLTNSEYLVYTWDTKNTKKICIIRSQDINARILMTLFQR
ncbi:hypothetical protein [Candidatus Uabimicrobium sp. HlEnr_7]|uniref:hypothetical protein n=1 Tax=Candidatus Uabimicrobium helgolandensis TaxID=3095367 RepID=UPI003556DC51